MTDGVGPPAIQEEPEEKEKLPEVEQATKLNSDLMPLSPQTRSPPRRMAEKAPTSPPRSSGVPGASILRASQPSNQKRKGLSPPKQMP